MAKSDRELRELFDQILGFLWNVSTGIATNQREAFEGVVRFSRFLISELERRDRLNNAGETAAFRRGKAIPNSMLNAWAWNILEDCRYHMVPPPRALLEFFYTQLGCTHMSPQRQVASEDVKRRARAMVASNQSIRVVARRFAVNPTTVMRWIREGTRDFNQEKYIELRKLTNVTRFYPTHRRRVTTERDTK
jgi:hypothetical protein